MKYSLHSPVVRNISADLNFNQPELSIKIDRDKAGCLSVSMQHIDTALQIALGQPQINEFSLNGYAYYVIPQLSSNQYNTSSILNRITVRTDSGKLIPLSTLISLGKSVTASSFNHFQGKRAATFNVQLASNYSTQQGINYFIRLAKKAMTGDMSYGFSGQTRLYMQTKQSMLMVFIAALFIIFLVLAAQFESFRDPIVILVTVPLAITGALGTLFFTGSSLNVYTEIGLVTLIGLISKHGILLVEFAKQARWQQGFSPFEAILQAASIRLRPILMTTAAMVLGSIPLILAHGAGASARQELGWTIAGGMTIGTFFTLFILPTVYLLLPGKNVRKLDYSQGGGL